MVAFQANNVAEVTASESREVDVCVPSAIKLREGAGKYNSMRHRTRVIEMCQSTGSCMHLTMAVAGEYGGQLSGLKETSSFVCPLIVDTLENLGGAILMHDKVCERKLPSFLYQYIIIAARRNRPSQYTLSRWVSSCIWSCVNFSISSKPSGS